MSSIEGIGIIISLSLAVGAILGIIRAILNRNKHPKSTVSEPASDKEEKELSCEDSEFDGEIQFDDPLFPPEEFDDE